MYKVCSRTCNLESFQLVRTRWMCNQTAVVNVEDVKHIADAQGADTLVNYVKLFDKHMGLLSQKPLKYATRMLTFIINICNVGVDISCISVEAV